MQVGWTYKLHKAVNWLIDRSINFPQFLPQIFLNLAERKLRNISSTLANTVVYSHLSWPGNWVYVSNKQDRKETTGREGFIGLQNIRWQNCISLSSKSSLRCLENNLKSKLNRWYQKLGNYCPFIKENSGTLVARSG